MLYMTAPVFSFACLHHIATYIYIHSNI
uniref:Uncharacterized protein n=1 Tax=Arundo donax TaxID=35708 RepID=A0A0A9H9V4_ARUDO